MKTVMVIDDSAFIRAELESMLRSEGYQVIAHARSGEEAVEMIKDIDPDLVTLDIIMPGMDGVDTASLLIQEKPGIKNRIIMLSSLYDLDIKSEIERIGLHHMVPKPIEKDILLRVIDEIEMELEQGHEEA